MNLLIASSRKTCNSQSFDSRNQNPTYGINGNRCVHEYEFVNACVCVFVCVCMHVCVGVCVCVSNSEKNKILSLVGNNNNDYL